MIRINGIEIDAEAICSISHNCNPDVCKTGRCCCSCYEICIDLQELSTIIDYLSEAAKFAPHLKSGSDFENVFDELKPDLFAIDTDDDGLCVFAYLNKDGQTLCSLHSAALRLGLPPHEVKPKSCTLWPLAITEDLPLNLSTDKDAFSFPCNSQRDVQEASLCPSVADIVKNIFGTNFLEHLREIIV